MSKWVGPNAKKYHHQYYLAHKEKSIVSSYISTYKNLYHTTPETIFKLRELQGGVCAICGKQASLRIDHDHTSGKLRELLCHSCNVGLGQFKDSPDLLSKAIVYILKHRVNNVA